MTTTEFRELALTFPEAIESAHMHHPDFRVGGRIFATLGYPNENSAMVKLSLDDQKQFIRSSPTAFAAVKGAWGRQGATNINLPTATVGIVRKALAAAWGNTAPKRLSKNRYRKPTAVRTRSMT
jgi:hypothetical protein